MRLGSFIVLLYWVVFTIRKGFTPKLNLRIKANKYDRQGNNEIERKKAQRLYYPLTAAEWLLKLAGWVEIALLLALLAWLVVIVGAIMTSGFVVIGNPALRSV